MDRYKKALLFELLVLGYYVLKKGIPRSTRNVGAATFNKYSELLLLFQQRRNKDHKKSIIREVKEWIEFEGY